jgi:hypothetical protein
MNGLQGKSDKIISILRKSRPDPGDVGRISEKVVSRIQKERTSVSVKEIVYEFIFGWVYKGWIRRSMVTAALVLVVFFVYQQALILKRINSLSGQYFTGAGSVKTGITDDFSDKLRIFKLYGKKAAESKINFSQKDIDIFIESVNDIQTKYKDLLDIINSDPQLKKYFEERINKIEQAKPKI